MFILKRIFNMNRILRIGTDCSGIEALRQLKIPFRHVFASEIDPFARKSLLANNHPEILFEDLTKRNHSKCLWISVSTI